MRTTKQELTAIFMKRLRTILFSGFSDLRCPGNKELSEGPEVGMCEICNESAEVEVDWSCPCTRFGEEKAKRIAIRVVERYFGQKIHIGE